MYSSCLEDIQDISLAQEAICQLLPYRHNLSVWRGALPWRSDLALLRGFPTGRAIHLWVIDEGTGRGKEEKVQEPFCLQMQVEEPDFRPRFR